MRKQETATSRVKIYPTTHRKLKIKAAREGKTMAQIIDREIFPKPNLA